eukprot:5015619-Pyramimonas_sp.AAC.1
MAVYGAGLDVRTGRGGQRRVPRERAVERLREGTKSGSRAGAAVAGGGGGVPARRPPHPRSLSVPLQGQAPGEPLARVRAFEWFERATQAVATHTRFGYTTCYTTLEVLHPAFFLVWPSAPPPGRVEHIWAGGGESAVGRKGAGGLSKGASWGS